LRGVYGATPHGDEALGFSFYSLGNKTNSPISGNSKFEGSAVEGWFEGFRKVRVGMDMFNWFIELYFVVTPMKYGDLISPMD
jgi:hypothetical protein